MSFTKAAFRVHFYLQNFIQTPFIVDSNLKFLQNSNSHQKRYQKLVKALVWLSLLFIIPFSFGHWFWLFFHWKSFTIYHVDRLVYYSFLPAFVFVCVSGCVTQHKRNILLQYAVNQSCKIEPATSTSTILTASFQIPLIGVISIKEIVVYCLSSGIFIEMVGLSALPFYISYDPVQLIIGSNIIFVKIFAAFISWWYVSFLSTTFLSMLLISIAFLEGVISLSERLHLHRKTALTLTSNTFYHCYKKLQELHVFTIVGNDAIEEYNVSMVFAGVFLASSSAYMMFKMYSMVNLVVYMFAPAITCLCFLIAIILTYLANVPHKSSKIFLIFWKRRVNGKIYNILLRSCKSAGFSLGPYGTATAKLGIQICDDIIKNTVTMLLLDGP